MCAVFGSAFTCTGKDDRGFGYAVHVGKRGFPFGVVFKTFGRYCHIKTVVRIIDVLSERYDVNAGTGCHIDANIFNGLEKVADGSVDVQRSYFEDANTIKKVGVCLFQRLQEVSLLLMCHGFTLAG